ncbi:hypothetical protein OG301_39000 (plasmid) [Streptomyces platensis]|uniref:hypothetical protein n=1 Tax=Streptomyces platensis TaxID=58346 RepID=UPI002ED4F1B5|nr:hypothetical protein OG301_39000 [Streptomyces platensis]
MTQPDAPAWAIDLVIALRQHDDEHTNGDPCLRDALDAIPDDLKQHAEAIHAHTQPLRTQLREAEALAGRWEEKYFEMGEKRSEALAAVDRVQAVAREWEFMSGRREARRELLAAIDGPTEEQR